MARCAAVAPTGSIRRRTVVGRPLLAFIGAAVLVVAAWLLLEIVRAERADAQLLPPVLTQPVADQVDTLLPGAGAVTTDPLGTVTNVLPPLGQITTPVLEPVGELLQPVYEGAAPVLGPVGDVLAPVGEVTTPVLGAVESLLPPGLVPPALLPSNLLPSILPPGVLPPGVLPLPGMVPPVEHPVGALPGGDPGSGPIASPGGPIASPGGPIASPGGPIASPVVPTPTRPGAVVPIDPAAAAVTDQLVPIVATPSASAPSVSHWFGRAVEPPAAAASGVPSAPPSPAPRVPAAPAVPVADGGTVGGGTSGGRHGLDATLVAPVLLAAAGAFALTRARRTTWTDWVSLAGARPG